MSINPNLFIHKDDRAALNALKAIPGFTPLLKSFMKVWSEKQFNIENMSTNLKLGPNQLPKYYNMLIPICDKLGIDVPDLYLKLDVYLNSYTSGDTHPFIVITSGLLETLPDELIPTVLAHECGHIACHHVLYHTMGQIICSEAIQLLPFGELVSIPIQKAFSYWMRCSEYSADRVAAVCDGSPNMVIETMTRFAGFDKDIAGEINLEAFMNQAKAYKEMTDGDGWNKTLEFIMYSDNSHPMNAVRAYEINEWAKDDKFLKIVKYTNSDKKNIKEYIDELPVGTSSKNLIGSNYSELKNQLEELGFENITLNKVIEKGLLQKEGQVLSISIDDQDTFNDDEWFKINSKIVITYYEAETEEELLAKHPNELRIPLSSDQISGKHFFDVEKMIREAGFTNVVTEEVKRGKKGLFDKDNTVFLITINGESKFKKNDWFDKESIVKIQYNTFDKK